MSNESGAVVDGPLTGVTVVEIASIGPGPHAAMLLRDIGATILRVERPGGNGWPNPVVDRGRSVLELDLRSAAGKEQRSEEHTSELQSLMRISYAVFCLKKKKQNNN